MARNGVVNLQRGCQCRVKIEDDFRRCLADIVEQHPTYELYHRLCNQHLPWINEKRLFQGGMNAEHFIQLLETLSGENAHVNLKVVIFDNAPCHRRVVQAAHLEAGYSLKALHCVKPFLTLSSMLSAYKCHLKRELEETRPQLLTIESR